MGNSNKRQFSRHFLNIRNGGGIHIINTPINIPIYKPVFNYSELAKEIPPRLIWVKEFPYGIIFLYFQNFESGR